MNYQILKTELALPIYSGITDANIIIKLNSVAVASKKQILVTDIEKYLVVQHKYIPLIDSVDINAREAILSLNKLNSFDTLIPAYLKTLTNILDSLIAINLISTTDKTYILGMSDTFISKAEELGLGVIGLTDIKNARNYM